MGRASRTPVKRDRTFTGCWRCRTRKVKCDERKPECSACRRLDIPCNGYGPRLVWVEGNGHGIKSDGRRYIPCERTWGHLAVLDSDLVDCLIAQCDAEGNDWTISSHNPFGVFRGGSSSTVFTNNVTSFVMSDMDEKYLFHHYSTHVAFIMMPFDHPRNPWETQYPAVALQYDSIEEKALYNAILAHAAFHLAEMGCQKQKMIAAGTKHYNWSIQHLTASLRGPKRDYGSTVAAIMTLMMAEIYSGQSKKWKYHFQGAWALLREYAGVEPWKHSDFACSSTQSLFIIKIIGDTCSTPPEDVLRLTNNDIGNEDFARLISSTSDFGFTIGAHRELLECISTITAFSQRGKLTGLQSAERITAGILPCLDRCLSQIDYLSVRSIEQYQLRSFVFATYIYLYRTVFDRPPRDLTSYVSQTLTNVLAFYAQDRGNFSLWPAFIAAVEAYSDEDLIAAKTWLEKATQFGLGNRLYVKWVVEEVWHRREMLSRESGIEPGLIVIDWRQVMDELGMDILLV